MMERCNASFAVSVRVPAACFGGCDWERAAEEQMTGLQLLAGGVQAEVCCGALRPLPGAMSTQGVEILEFGLFGEGIAPTPIWQPPPHVADPISKSVFTGSRVCAS